MVLPGVVAWAELLRAVLARDLSLIDFLDEDESILCQLSLLLFAELVLTFDRPRPLLSSPAPVPSSARLVLVERIQVSLSLLSNILLFFSRLWGGSSNLGLFDVGWFGFLLL